MTRRERKREREREGKRERKEERKEDKPATANITFNDKNSFFPTTLWSKGKTAVLTNLTQQLWNATQ